MCALYSTERQDIKYVQKTVGRAPRIRNVGTGMEESGQLSAGSSRFNLSTLALEARWARQPNAKVADWAVMAVVRGSEGIQT